MATHPSPIASTIDHAAPRDAECIAADAARAPAPPTGQPAPSVASQGEASRGNPHYQLLGGEAAVRALVDRFYFHMDTLPAAAGIRAMHDADLGPVKDTLVRFLTEWLGGPQLYSPVRGQPRLRRKHLPFAIGAAERDAWMACMTRAVDEVCNDPSLKQQLLQAFFKTADFIRNDQGNGHDHAHGNHPHHPPGQAR